MSSGDLDDRDRAILSHIARYRLTFQEIVGHLYCDGTDPQKTFNDLRERGYVVARKGYGRNRSAYQLTSQGARAANAPRRRAGALGSEARPVHLAVLTFCFLKGRRRLRLEPGELNELFARQPVPPGRCHCVEARGKAARLYHVYVPGDTVPVVDVAGMTRTHLEAVLAIPSVAPWLHARVYCHAVLVDNAHRAAALNAAYDELLLSDDRRARDVADVRVELVPGLDTLEEALRALG